MFKPVVTNVEKIGMSFRRYFIMTIAKREGHPVLHSPAQSHFFFAERDEILWLRSGVENCRLFSIKSNIRRW